VAIRTSASQEVKRLVADLTSDGPDQATRRDAAIARLAVIGTRAVRQILDAIAAKPAPAQHASLLLALEAIPDPRTVDPVVQGLGAADAAVRLAAARAARGLLALPQGPSSSTGSRRSRSIAASPASCASLRSTPSRSCRHERSSPCSIG
jgi:hypothetical protein